MSDRPQVMVVVNPAARHGAAARLYARVQPALAARFSVDEVPLDDAGRWHEHLHAAIRDGVRTFIAAGGDGTVNAVAAALVAARRPCALPDLVLGAVGLGSSNDFHKPFGFRLRGVPARVDVARAAPRDIARASWRDSDGGLRERPFLVSASLGATAEANAFFGDGDAALRWLKPRLVGAAIVYAAMRTLASHRNVGARLILPDGTWPVPLTSLSISKTPHLAGAFRYDTPVAAADGRLAVNLCADMHRLRLLATLAALARGRFAGRPGTRHWSVESLEVHVDRQSALEIDGELYRTDNVRFDILPERLRVCA